MAIVGRKYKFQFLAVISVNILTIIYGTFSGWPSACFLELQAEDSPLKTGPMTSAETGWVASTFCMGGFFGTIFFTWWADRVGRKSCLMQMIIPFSIGWIIKYFAKSPFQLCIAQFIAGTTGAVLAILPIYVTEISENSVRGMFGSFTVPSLNIGVLFIYILGYYFRSATTTLICAPLAIAFLIAFYKFPETPQYFISKDNLVAAEKSLLFYRNLFNVDSKENISDELEHLKEEATVLKENLSWEDFSNRVARKALLIGIVLFLLSQLCGSLVLLNYASIIFKTSGSSLSPQLSAIIVGIILLGGSCVAPVFVERAGRKVLLAISLTGNGVGLIILGGYSYLTALGYDTQSFSWVSIASFSFTILIEGCGIITIPCFIVPEILPPKIRPIGGMLCILTVWISSFLVIMFFPILSESVGMHFLMFFFAVVSFIGAVFVIIIVPETKGKSIKEVLLLL